MFEYFKKFKCKCDTNIHTLTSGIQNDEKIKSHENVKCSDCHAIINVVDIIKLRISNKYKTLESINIGITRLPN